jgi:hypothetical protein
MQISFFLATMLMLKKQGVSESSIINVQEILKSSLLLLKKELMALFVQNTYFILKLIL